MHVCERPVVGIDIDGVIAVSEPAEVPVEQVTVTAWGRWRRTIALPVTAAAKTTALAERYEVVWVSAWGHTAHTSLRPVLDLSPEIWPFIPAQFDKADALARFAAGRPWVLVHDGLDDIPHQYESQVITLDPHRGIDSLELAEVERALRLMTERTPVITGGADK